MLEFISKLFGQRTLPCLECLRKQNEILDLQEMVGRLNERLDLTTDMRDEIRYLRAERADVQALLVRAMRLEPAGSYTAKDAAVKPVPMGLNSWGRARTALENQHKKHVSPEDKTDDYWKAKNDQLAHDAGLDQAWQSAGLASNAIQDQGGKDA